MHSDEASARLIPRLPVMSCAWAVHVAQIVSVLALAFAGDGGLHIASLVYVAHYSELAVRRQ